jgi:hypothetical protein
MKKAAFILVVLFTAAKMSSSAQEVSGTGNSGFNRNNIKLNILALPTRNFSFQYERGINENMSVALGIRLMPRGGVPLKGMVDNFVEIESEEAGAEETNEIIDDFLDNSKVSNWAITPEFRYYFGRQPLNGFYLAPFLRFGGFNLSWPTTFEADGEQYDVRIKGHATAFSAGLMLGAQWHIGERFLIDWWIAGPSYGSIKLTLKGEVDPTQVPAEVMNDVEEYLSFEINGKEVHPEVTEDAVKVTTRLPFGGFRTGLCLGFSF